MIGALTAEQKGEKEQLRLTDMQFDFLIDRIEEPQSADIISNKLNDEERRYLLNRARSRSATPSGQRLGTLLEAQRADTYPLATDVPVNERARAARLTEESQRDTSIWEAIHKGALQIPVLGPAAIGATRGLAAMGVPGAEEDVARVGEMLATPTVGTVPKVAESLEAMAGAGPLFEFAGGAVGGLLGQMAPTAGRLAQFARPVAQAAGTFGAFEAGTEAAREVLGEGRLSPTEVAKAGLHGMAVGAPMGLVGKATAGAPLIARIPLLTATLTGAGAALDRRLPTVDQILANTILVGLFETATVRNQRRATRAVTTFANAAADELGLDSRQRAFFARRVLSDWQDGKLTLESVPAIGQEALDAFPDTPALQNNIGAVVRPPAGPEVGYVGQQRAMFPTVPTSIWDLPPERMAAEEYVATQREMFPTLPASFEFGKPPEQQPEAPPTAAAPAPPPAAPISDAAAQARERLSRSGWKKRATTTETMGLQAVYEEIKDAAGTIIARFKGWQEAATPTTPDRPSIALYDLVQPVGKHPAGSTVSGETLAEEGLTWRRPQKLDWTPDRIEMLSNLHYGSARDLSTSPESAVRSFHRRLRALAEMVDAELQVGATEQVAKAEDAYAQGDLKAATVAQELALTLIHRTIPAFKAGTAEAEPTEKPEWRAKLPPTGDLFGATGQKLWDLVAPVVEDVVKTQFYYPEGTIDTRLVVKMVGDILHYGTTQLERLEKVEDAARNAGILEAHGIAWHTVRDLVDRKALELLPTAKPGIQSEAKPGHRILFRTARSPQEVYAILNAVEKGDLSTAFRPSVSHVRQTVRRLAERATRKGKTPIFVSNYPSVAGFYRNWHAKLPMTFALEVPEDAVLYRSTYVEREPGKGIAASTTFADTELLIDGKRVSKLWHIPQATMRNIMSWAQELDRTQSKGTGFRNVFRDADPDLAAAGAAAIADLREPPKSLGRPFLDVPMEFKGGQLKKGGRALLYTGDIVKVKNIREVKPENVEYSPSVRSTPATNISSYLEVTGYRGPRLYGFIDELNIPDAFVAKVLKPGERVTEKLRQEIITQGQTIIDNLRTVYTELWQKIADEVRSSGDEPRAQVIEARIDDLSKFNIAKGPPTPEAPAAAPTKSRSWSNMMGSFPGNLQPFIDDLIAIGKEKLSGGNHSFQEWWRSMRSEFPEQLGSVKRSEALWLYEATQRDYAKSAATPSDVVRQLAPLLSTPALDSPSPATKSVATVGQDVADNIGRFTYLFTGHPNSSLEAIGFRERFMQSMASITDTFLSTSPRGKRQAPLVTPRTDAATTRTIAASRSAFVMATMLWNDGPASIFTRGTNVFNRARIVRARQEMALRLIHHDRAIALESKAAAISEHINTLQAEIESLRASPDDDSGLRILQLEAELESLRVPSEHRIPKLTPEEYAWATQDPAMQSFIEWYRDTWTPVVEALSADAGISTRLTGGPLGGYVSYAGRWRRLPAGASPDPKVYIPSSARSPFDVMPRRPQAARAATGAAPEIFDLDPDIFSYFTNTLSDRMSSIAKSELMAAVRAEAVAKRSDLQRRGIPVPPETTIIKTSKGPIHVPVRPVTFERLGGRIEDTYYVPQPVAELYRLATSRPTGGELRSIERLGNALTAQVILLPAEAVRHGLNVMQAVTATEWAAKHGHTARFVEAMTGMYGKMLMSMWDMFNLHGESFARDMQVLADNNGLRLSNWEHSPEPPGLVQYLHKGRFNPFHWLKDSVFGYPGTSRGFGGIETRFRVAMLRAMRSMSPEMSDEQRVRMINDNVGTYVREVVPPLASALQNVYPFARARTALVKHGVRTATSIDSLSRFNPYIGLAAASTIFNVCILNKLLDDEKRWPWEVPGWTPGSIILFEWNGRKVSLGPDLIINPLHRALQLTGARSVIENALNGATSPDTYFFNWTRSLANFGLSWAGPLAATSLVATTGRVPYITRSGELLPIEEATMSGAEIGRVESRLKAMFKQGIPLMSKGLDWSSASGARPRPTNEPWNTLYSFSEIFGVAPEIGIPGAEETTAGRPYHITVEESERVALEAYQRSRNLFTSAELRIAFIRDYVNQHTNPTAIVIGRGGKPRPANIHSFELALAMLKNEPKRRATGKAYTTTLPPTR